MIYQFETFNKYNKVIFNLLQRLQLKFELIIV